MTTVYLKNLSLYWPRDPSYVTPLVKSMLAKRNRLRNKGRLLDANKLAEKINLCIQDVRTKQYSRMSQASPKELWPAVKATNGSHRRTEKLSYLLRDVERVNNYFASVCYDPSSSAARGICRNRSLGLCNPHNSNIVLQPYEVERLLSKMKASSPGLDNIPHWFFRTCSYEIAETVADILNLSFASGTVPKQWLSAVVTPIPKVAKPETLSDYKAILVTPLLSGLAENWQSPDGFCQLSHLAHLMISLVFAQLAVPLVP